jgi:putative protease
MACWDTPASTGEYIGTTIRHNKRSIDVSPADSAEIHAGDGICYNDTGFAVSKTEGNTIYAHDDGKLVMPADGTRLYRNQDTHFLRSLTAERRIAVNITVQETDTGFYLTMHNDTFTTSLKVEDEKQPAIQEERALNTMREQMQKLGDTPFVAEKITLHTRPYFLPIKTLNQWRRQLTDNALTTLASQNKPQDIQRDLPQSVALDPTQREDGNLMTCKYCILNELGHCRKTNPMPLEPAYLRLKNGKQMQLKFHCNTCEMEILESE